MHINNSCWDKLYKILFFIAYADSTEPVELNAQHPPHFSWFFTDDTLFFSLQSTDLYIGGNLSSSILFFVVFKIIKLFWFGKNSFIYSCIFDQYFVNTFDLTYIIFLE